MPFLGAIRFRRDIMAAPAALSLPVILTPAQGLASVAFHSRPQPSIGGPSADRRDRSLRYRVSVPISPKNVGFWRSRYPSSSLCCLLMTHLKHQATRPIEAGGRCSAAGDRLGHPSMREQAHLAPGSGRRRADSLALV